MHDYAIFGHDRANIGRWLGFASITAAGGLAQLFTFANSLTGIDAFLKASVATGAIYFGLHWAFNKWGWKIPFFKIPDLNGVWDVKGQTLTEDGSTMYDWDAVIGIEQSWKEISIHLKTKNSQSNSYTATLSKRGGPTGGWLLSYSYRNEPELEQSHELSSHKGYCEIEFDNQLTLGKTAYFNSAGRRTFGVMKLVRQKTND